MAVAEAADVADHGPDRGGAREGEARGMPRRRLRPLAREPAVQARRQERQHLVQPVRPPLALRHWRALFDIQLKQFVPTIPTTMGISRLILPKCLIEIWF